MDKISFLETEIPFFQTPNSIFDLNINIKADKRVRKKGYHTEQESRPLKAHEKLVYIFLCRCGNNGRQAFPSYNTISKKCNISRTSAIEAIKVLEKNNLILKQCRKKDESNIYIIKQPLVCQAHHPSTPGTPLPVRQAHHPSTPGAPKKELSKKNYIKKIYINIVEYLNKKIGTKYRSTTKKTQQLINSRLEEGFKEEDFYTVINKKVQEWQGTQMEMYLRPETLFGTKFEGYLNQKGGAKNGNGNKSNKYNNKQNTKGEERAEEYDFSNL